MKRTRTLSLLLCAAMILSLVFSISAFADTDEFLRFGSGPSSGANYTTCAGFANLIAKDHPSYMCSAEISTGSQENIRMMADGSAEFGIAMSDVELAAFTGTREFDGNPQAITHVMGGYTTTMHIFVAKDSSISSIADMKGKKLCVGSGAMSQYYLPILLGAYGLTVDDVTVTSTSLQSICDAVNDGNADMGIHITPYTSSPIADLAATKGIRFISIGDAEMEKITSENPYFYRATIPAGTYTGVDEETVSIGTRNNLICRADISEEVVYNVVKTLIEHQADLPDVHPQAKHFNTENAVEGALIDIHPGALKYYREIGLVD